MNPRALGGRDGEWFHAFSFKIRERNGPLPGSLNCTQIIAFIVMAVVVYFSICGKELQ